MLFFDLFRHDQTFIKIPAGEALFREGELGEVMYVLVAGEAEITINGVMFEKCVQGTIIGEMAVIESSPHAATVNAKSDCKFVIVDSKRFHFLVTETPGFAIEIMRIIAQRLRRCDLRVIQTAPE